MHLLQGRELSAHNPRTLRPFAAVRATGRGLRKPELKIEPGVVVVREGTLFAPLPERVRVLGPDGIELNPSECRGGLFIAVDCIHPSYLLIETDGLAWKPISNARD